jgi:hypothetical protein
MNISSDWCASGDTLLAAFDVARHTSDAASTSLILLQVIAYSPTGHHTNPHMTPQETPPSKLQANPFIVQHALLIAQL